MDTTVVQPKPEQTVVTTSNHGGDHGRHHEGGDSWDKTTLREVLAMDRFAVASRERDAAAAAVAACHGIDETKDARRDVVGNIGDAARAAALASCKTDDGVSAGFGRLAGIVNHGTEEAHENFALIQKQLSDTATATVVGFKDAQAVAYQIEGRSQLEAAKNFYALNVQATANFNAIQVEAVKNAAAAALAQEKCCCELKEKIAASAAAAELTARTLAATAAAQLAACCCELKSQAAAIDTQRIRDDLAQAQARLLALSPLIPTARVA